jgi:hypothetical protein
MIVMSARAKIGLASLTVVISLGGAWLWLATRSQPQLPANDELLKAVDGLFTAVTARDTARLAKCHQRLAAIHSAGALPPAAWKRLQNVISMSERGQWEPAARQLYDFIQGQRREGDKRQENAGLTAMAR